MLRDRGVEPEVVEYLKTPPSAAELDDILRRLNLEPRELMRRKETIYVELGLGDASITRERLIDAMVTNPILIERPIVLAGAKAAIGRPPESVLSIIS